jgi:hypothetical protein
LFLHDVELSKEEPSKSSLPPVAAICAMMASPFVCSVSDGNKRNWDVCNLRSTEHCELMTIFWPGGLRAGRHARFGL